MKFQFESHLEHQDNAVKSIVDIFSGIKTRNGVFSIARDNQTSLFENAHKGISNIIQTNNWISEIAQFNIKEIQERNGLHKTEIDTIYPTFDVEMETGTGKTYVFLKTILELNANYDFKKFIIVVPSIAIKEGILKTLEMTKEHFKNLYPSIKYRYYEYDGQSLQTVWNFANNNNVEIMIANIQSINKDINIFHKNQDYLSGDKPQDLIRNTNPIIIIDEPQSTSSGKKSDDAIKNLNPLFIIRYSATFKERKTENLVYKLDSFDAYEKRLVKKINVLGSQIENNTTSGYIRLVSLDIKKQSAKIEIKVATSQGSVNKKIPIYNDTDIYMASGRLEEYKDLSVVNIDFANKLIELSNGEIKVLNANDEVFDLEIKKTQIRETIQKHLDTQLKLKDKGIKVLSLFFIDKVSKYRDKDENGNDKLGEYAQIFQEEFMKIMSVSSGRKYWSLFDEKDIKDIQSLATKIHGGYFSIDNKNNLKDTKGNTKDDKSTYDKIMKDKEKLISFDEKLAFIFSHSALKEGWDNPNVFQICTLNDTKSDIKRRQEIGRGLRLCVNQEGIRIYDESVNVLSVFTNSSYEEFVESLQKEMKEDGMIFGKIERLSFNNDYIDKQTSIKIYDLLFNQGIINKNGELDTKEYKKELVMNLLDSSQMVAKEQIDFIVGILESSTKKLNINNGRKQIKNEINKEVINSEEFQKLWTTINTKTTYSVSFDSNEFIKQSKQKIIKKIEDIESAKIVTTKANVNIKRSGIEVENIGKASVKQINDSDINIKLIDLVSDIEQATKLTRKTIVEIVTEYEIVESIKKNQEAAKKIIIKAMNDTKQELMIDGIEYKKTNDDFYEQKLLNDEVEIILDDNCIDASNSEKYPYKYIVVDNSKIEKKFGEDSLKADMVKKFIKLPKWFKIKTPLGNYNPDWSLYDNNEVIFVAETKGSIDDNDLRSKERLKIKCGKEHFRAINESIKYEVTDSLNHLLLKSKEKENE